MRTKVDSNISGETQGLRWTFGSDLGEAKRRRMRKPPVSILIGSLILGGGVIRAIFGTRNPNQHLPLAFLPGQQPSATPQTKSNATSSSTSPSDSRALFFSLAYSSPPQGFPTYYETVHTQIHMLFTLFPSVWHCSQTKGKDLAEREKKKRMNECRLNFYLFWLCCVFIERHIPSQFPNQGWNPYLPHWKASSLPLNHQGNPCLNF